MEKENEHTGAREILIRIESGEMMSPFNARYLLEALEKAVRPPQAVNKAFEIVIEYRHLYAVAY